MLKKWSVRHRLKLKSSQIEGNTYSLLETERLLTEREEAKGKSKEEAIMLLNHKEAFKIHTSRTGLFRDPNHKPYRRHS